MYVANHFRLPDDRLEALLTQVHRGNLVTIHDDGPRSTLVPLFMEERDGERVFVTHLVRNNPQAREPITGRGMVILDIMDAYVSPAWYETNDRLPNVPTWDYVTIHATGEIRLDPSPKAALAAAAELTRRMGEQWVIDRVGDDKLERMARAIVAVELRADTIEAKAKMSQNRHPDDVRSVLAAFEEQGHTDMAEYLRDVSLPYAEARLGLIQDLRAGRELDVNPAE